MSYLPDPPDLPEILPGRPADDHIPDHNDERTAINQVGNELIDSRDTYPDVPARLSALQSFVQSMGDWFAAYGNSWGAEVNYLGQPLAVNQYNWWTRRVARALGIRDNNTYSYPGGQYQLAGGIGSNDRVSLGRGDFPAGMEGQLDAVQMRTHGGLVGSGSNYRNYALRTSRTHNLSVNMAQATTESETIGSGALVTFEFTNTYGFEQLRLIPNDGFIMFNTAVGSSHADDGFTVMIRLNGGPYSNYCRGSSMLSQTGLHAGGHGEINQAESIKLVSAGDPVVDFDGFYSPTPACPKINLLTHIQNDIGCGQTVEGAREVVRFIWTLLKSFVRRAAGHTSITYDNGSGGGTWSLSTTTPPEGVNGGREFFSGAIGAGAGAPSASFDIEAEFPGCPIALHFFWTPSREQTIVTTNGSDTIVGGPFYATDDIGAQIAGDGITPGTTIDTVFDDTTASMSAVATADTTSTKTIGIGGGLAHIEIDGAAPDFAGGVRINNTTDDTVNTDKVSPFNGYGRVGINRSEAGFPAVRICPMSKVITGLDPGTHTIDVILDEYPGGATLNRFYMDGYTFEATYPTSPPVHMMKQPTLMVTSAVYGRTMHGATGDSNIAPFNDMLDDLKAEFAAANRDFIYLLPLDTTMTDPDMFDSGGSHASGKGFNHLYHSALASIRQSFVDILAAIDAA